MICYTSTKNSDWKSEVELFASKTGLPFHIKNVGTPAAKIFCENLAQKFGYDLFFTLPKTAFFRKRNQLSLN